MDPDREDLKNTLLEMIRDFFDAHLPMPGGVVADQELRGAAAALMVCLLRADGESLQDEHHALGEAIGQVLDLTGEEAARLVRYVEERVTNGVRFAELVQSLDAGCDVVQKKQLVESLWRIAFADATLDGQEEYLVRKVAEHLHLSNADLIETKVRAKQAFLEGGG